MTITREQARDILARWQPTLRQADRDHHQQHMTKP